MRNGFSLNSIPLPRLSARGFGSAKVYALGAELHAKSDNGRYELDIVSDYGKLWVTLRTITYESCQIDLTHWIKGLPDKEIPEVLLCQLGHFENSVKAWDAVVDDHFASILESLQMAMSEEPHSEFDKVLYAGSSNGRECHEILSLLCGLGVSLVAVGNDMIVTGNTDVLDQALESGSKIPGWTLLEPNTCLRALTPVISISWLSLHCFGDRVRTTPNIHEDSELFIVSDYRQNVDAIAEIYVWDDCQTLIVLPKCVAMPTEIGRIRQTDRFTLSS